VKLYAAAAPPEDPDIALRLVFQENLLTGRAAFRALFGAPTSLEEDLLNVLAAIYAADLAVRREPREGFLRDIELTIAVVNHHAFQALQPDFEFALYLLSQDNWSLHFQATAGQPEPHQAWARDRGITLLFSGGLDSFCGAADLAQQPRPFQLVSHVTHNQAVSDAQTELHEALEQYAGRAIPRLTARVSGRSRGSLKFPADNEREDSQRSRSLLFLGLAALAARRTGFSEVVTIAENGQMALHLPLTAARVAAFSTHTAHPEFVSRAEALFSQLLSYPLRFTNPYLYLTKSEVVCSLPPALHASIPRAISCWRGSRLTKNTHCGECVPCLVRRLALAGAGMVLDEYERDVFNEDMASVPPDNRGKLNLVELMELVRRFSTADPNNHNVLIEQFPDLVNPHIDLAAAISLYRRFAVEATATLSAYPYMRALLT
jgi:7-cyano-7-deazaguanine synthase in queuosine biosynthesis